MKKLKLYRGEEVYLHAFITLALDGASLHCSSCCQELDTAVPKTGKSLLLLGIKPQPVTTAILAHSPH
jgi:hypothetical protein